MVTAEDLHRAGPAVDGGERLADAHAGVLEVVAHGAGASGANVGRVVELARGLVTVAEHGRFGGQGVGRVVAEAVRHPDEVDAAVRSGARAAAVEVVDVVLDTEDGVGDDDSDDEDEKSEKISTHFFP